MDNATAISTPQPLTGAERAFPFLDFSGLNLADPMAVWKAFHDMREAAFDAQVEFTKAFLDEDGPARNAALLNAREHCRAVANLLRELKRQGFGQ